MNECVYRIFFFAILNSSFGHTNVPCFSQILVAEGYCLLIDSFLDISKNSLAAKVKQMACFCFVATFLTK